MAIPKGLIGLRQAMQILDEGTKCPRCGKSRFHAATGFRGHGTGEHGSAAYEATGFENDPAKHCQCTVEEMEAWRGTESA